MSDSVRVGRRTIAISERLAEGGDPWRGIGRHARAIGPARRALDGRAG